MIIEDFPNIVRWMFKDKPSNLDKITEHFGEQRRDLIQLFQIINIVELLHQSNCLNIECKLAEATNWDKLVALESELFFAKEFGKLGFSVTFISDSDREWYKGKQQTPSPDLLVEKDGEKILIEVARISDDETRFEIQDRLIKIVRQTGFAITIQYSKEFSVPAICHKSREVRHKQIDEFVREFTKAIPLINANVLPEEKNILGCKVKFEKSCHNYGYFRGGLTAVLISPHEDIEPHIKRILKNKAEKREKFSDVQKNIPYLVALDIQQKDFWVEHHLTSLLFGGRRYIGELSKTREVGIPYFSEPQSVKLAKERGWEEYLKSIGFDPNSDNPINPDTEPAILLNNHIISKNLTGVIVRNREKLEFVPNPFAEEIINRPDLRKGLPSLSSIDDWIL